MSFRHWSGLVLGGQHNTGEHPGRLRHRLADPDPEGPVAADRHGIPVIQVFAGDAGAARLFPAPTFRPGS